MVNIMDIRIIDLQGEEYDINSIHMKGNDCMDIVIKKESEDYFSINKAEEELCDKRN